ncbi:MULTISPECIES: DUF6286 domain-containing protein [unclassified Streptomyces]|uniref:DUF6286 domain-containing protein n=1 Tax=unclassified Streptomyces TaxID=2593676 RepID=UPI000F6D7745|nr:MULTISPECIES: DUF6286 domain-containing protein [unclassified Streptomyces]AZM63024.1 hypothetical protein DLM49_28870 [Streptomyces sp. WAC 01438]RSM99277.1 hypothetical protein DMA10_07020 [Streptomyces sp. WAC 01420]
MSEPHGTVLEKHPPSAGDGADTAGGGDDGHRRFWSARRVPAGLLALVLLVVAGAFLYDIVAVRADRAGMSWRRELARQLAQRPLDDVWVLTGAAVAAALGLWLVVLAVTPGLRSLLPMRRTHPDVRAGLHRAAAAMVLRDRAMEVAGVQSVRVEVKRRRADVRAVSHFRALDDVRADVTEVLDEAIRGLGLARPPTLSLQVRRPGRKGR